MGDDQGDSRHRRHDADRRRRLAWAARRRCDRRGPLASLLIVRSPQTSVRQLGRERASGVYYDVERRDDLETVAGVIIARIDGPLFFADADRFRTSIRDLLGENGKPRDLRDDRRRGQRPRRTHDRSAGLSATARARWTRSQARGPPPSATGRRRLLERARGLRRDRPSPRHRCHRLQAARPDWWFRQRRRRARGRARRRAPQPPAGRSSHLDDVRRGLGGVVGTSRYHLHWRSITGDATTSYGSRDAGARSSRRFLSAACPQGPREAAAGMGAVVVVVSSHAGGFDSAVAVSSRRSRTRPRARRKTSDPEPAGPGRRLDTARYRAGARRR